MKIQVANQLKENLEGVKVYTQNEIPEHLHWKVNQISYI